MKRLVYLTQKMKQMRYMYTYASYVCMYAEEEMNHQLPFLKNVSMRDILIT